jgi:hypothetical protein
VNKKFLITILVLILIGAGGYYVFNLKHPLLPKEKEKQVYITKFNGNLTGIKDNEISLKGVYLSSTYLPPPYQDSRDFTFSTDENTTWERIVITMPSIESLKKLGTTTYEIKSLPHNKVEGSLEDLNKLPLTEAIFVQADFSTSISDSSKVPVATKVSYKILMQPSTK